MISSLYSKAKEKFLSAGIDLTSAAVKAALVDLDVYGLAVVGASYTNPLQITTATAHGLSNNMLVGIIGTKGNLAANGLFITKNVTSTTFELVDRATGANIVGSAVYTSGGRVIPLGLHEFRSSLSGVAALSAALTSKSVASGIFSAADTVFTSVPAGATCEAVVLYTDTGNAATDRLICLLDELSGLPVTPNGASIPVSWDTGRLKIFEL